MTRRSLALALCLLPLSACDAVEQLDAGLDAGIDAGRPDAGIDSGPMCAPVCEPTETCCPENDGTNRCVALRNDPRHCGICDIDCIETHRGEACSASQCTCGETILGCTGNRQSFCCPPRIPEGVGYCADLDRDASDCGGCDAGCDLRVTDRCSGGRCVCGTERGPCAAGTRCCAAGVDVDCADLSTDRLHCGACNRACAAAERCEAGTCTEGATCAGACTLSESCCHGTCCPTGRCVGGTCGPPRPDAGTSDAGSSDAGSPDAGSPDAGSPDAGIADAGA